MSKEYIWPVRSSGSSGGRVNIVGHVLGWGYQDFAVPVGPGPLTLTENKNGLGIVFSSAKVVSGTAVIVRTLDPESYAYSGTTRLFSTKVKVTNHTADIVTLNVTPHIT